MRGSNVDYSLDQSQHGRVERREAGSEVRTSAIDSERVLHEVVGADAEKRDIVDERVDRERRRRGFHHHTEWKIVAVRYAASIELGGRLVHQMRRLLDLGERDDEGEHYAHGTVHLRPAACKQLGVVQLRLLQAHAAYESD